MIATEELQRIFLFYMSYYGFYPGYLHIVMKWDCFGALKLWFVSTYTHLQRYKHLEIMFVMN